VQEVGSFRILIQRANSDVANSLPSFLH
jgi:hypothetical protein